MSFEEIVEGRWDCPSCNHKLIRGSIRICPNCSLGRGDGVKFYNISGDDYDSADIVTDKKQLHAALVGKDLVCEICRGLNQRDAEYCINCGNILLAGSREQGESPLPQSADPVIVRREKEKRKAKKQKIVLFSLIGAAVVAVFLIFGWLMYANYLKHKPYLTILTAQSVEWVRTVNYSEYERVTEHAFDLPARAVIIDKDWRDHPTKREQVGTRTITVHHSHQEVDRVEQIPYEEPVYERRQTGTRRVKTGSEDLGNGHFRNTYDDVPVYSEVRVGSKTRYKSKTHYKTVKDPDTYRYEPIMAPVKCWYYTYTIDKWVNKPSLVLRGYDGMPVWPIVSNLDNTEVLGNRRLLSKNEKYDVTFIDKNKITDDRYHGVRHWTSSDASLMQLKGKELTVVVSYDKIVSLDIKRGN